MNANISHYIYNYKYKLLVLPAGVDLHGNYRKYYCVRAVLHMTAKLNSETIEQGKYQTYRETLCTQVSSQQVNMICAVSFFHGDIGALLTMEPRTVNTR